MAYQEDPYLYNLIAGNMIGTRKFSSAITDHAKWLHETCIVPLVMPSTKSNDTSANELYREASSMWHSYFCK